VEFHECQLTTITLTEFYNLCAHCLGSILVIDERLPEEFLECHVEHAVNLPNTPENYLSELAFQRCFRELSRRRYCGKVVFVSKEGVAKDKEDAQSTRRSSNVKAVRREEDVPGLRFHVAEVGFQEIKKGYPFFCARVEEYSDHAQDEMISWPSLVVADWLYLGDIFAAENMSVLKSLKISSIVNCTEDDSKFEDEAGFQYYHVNIHDLPGEDIASHFDEALGFIDQAQKSGRKVLVHCHAGVSRSPTLVLAYLMRSFRWPLDDAMNYLYQRRPSICPNSGFLSQLREFEKCLTKPQ